VTVTDTLPAGVTFLSATGAGWTCTTTGDVSVSCTRLTLVAGATAPTITVVVTAPGQATTLTNSASVASTTADPDPTNNSSSVTTGVTASADLAIAKTGPATVVAGGTISYSLAVTNNGPSDAVGLTVTDTLPAGVTFVSAAGSGWTCTNTGNTSVSCTRPALATGAVAPSITVVVTAPAQAASLSNSASVASTTADADSGNNTSSAATTVSASADLSITKSGPATVAAGGNVSYNLVVANAGPSDATTLTVTDTLPAGVTFVSATGTGWTCSNSGSTSVTCTRPALAAGATSPTITIVVTAPAQAASLTNSATVASTTADPVPGNNSSSATTGVTASADLAITKSGPATVVGGGNVSYGLLVGNLGPSDAAVLTVTDTLPAGVTFGSAAGTGWTCTHAGNVSVSCTRPALAGGSTAPTITFVVTAPAQAGSLTNTASVASTTADPDLSNNSSNVTTTVTASADLSITKAGPPTVTAAGNVSYTLVVANAGPSDAATLTVTDILPTDVTFVSAEGTGWTCTNAGNVTVTCTRAALVTGASAPTITVVVTAPAQTASLTNTATIGAVTTDPNPANNTSTVTTTVSSSADLSIAKSGPPTVSATGAVTYSLVVVNVGPSDADNLTVTDTLPAGVAFVSAVGTGWTCTNTGNFSVTCTSPALVTGATAPTITVVVNAPPQATSLTNSASVSSTTADPNPANNSSSVTTGVTGSADLSIAKTGPATVVAGSNVSYSVVVTNVGPSDAAGLTVTDTLPAGVTFGSAAGTGWTCTHVGSASISCTRAALASGTSAPSIIIVVTAPAQASALSNTASVSSTTADPDPTNNTSSVPTAVTDSADLSIVKAGPAHVDSGGAITYTLTVSNAGPSNAADLTVVDTLPAAVTLVSATGTGWTCTAVTSTVTCTNPALASGSSSVITVVATAPVGSTALLNTATVASATPDPTPENNTSSAPTQVAGSADLSIVKTGPATVVAGTSVTYAISVSNAGPDDAVSLVMVDTLPAGVTFVSAAGSGWTCASTGNVSVTCTRALLANGATAPRISLVVGAPATAGPMVNRAAVESSTTDPTPLNNASSAPVVVLAAPSGGGGGGNGGDGGNGGTPGGNGGQHPQTGADIPGELTWALALLVGGAFLLGALPRRRTTR
jgi:uncharacterized repeat protein (TIGR01451 family)